MAELIADLVLHATAVRRGRSLESGQQSASGQRPGLETAKEFWYWDNTTIYVAGVPVTIPARQKAQVYGTGGTTFDLTASRWISFIVQGNPQHYITPAQLWTTLAATVNIIGIEYHTRSNWRRHQPFAASSGGPPPPPPVVIDSSGGGVGIVILYGSNPYVLHAGFAAGTKTLTLLTTQLQGADQYALASIPRGPQQQYQQPEYPDYQNAAYPDGSQPMFHNFDAHANAGDHWPLPLAPYDTVNYPSAHVDHTIPAWSSFWPRWRDPAFGVTNRAGQFAANALWDKNPSEAVAMWYTGVGGPGHVAAGTYPKRAQERILIRGNVPLPALAAGATVTAIAWASIVDNHFQADSVTLNDGSDGTTQPGLATVDYGTAAMAEHFWNYTTSLPYWNFGGDNLLYMEAQCDLEDGVSNVACAWIDIAFTIDAGTGPYQSPPTGWEQKAFPADTWTPSTQGDPGGFFGRGTRYSITFGFIGARSRYYVRSNFIIPPGTYTSASLAITARTGIGAIYVNNNLLVTRDETIDLWDSSTVLTFPIPLSWLLFGAVITNELAVQAYTADGNTAIDYRLSLS